jgi:hypothetical protein
MKATIQLVSLKDASLTPQKREIDLSGPRPTENIGAPIRTLCESWLVKYKQPLFELVIDGEVRGQVKPSGKMLADKIASVNFGISEAIVNTRFTTAEMTNDKATKDSVALNIAKAFGHKGPAVSVRAACGNIQALEKAIKVTRKWTKVDIEDKYRASVDPRILELEDNATKERKALAVAKKQLTAGK